MDYSHLNRKLFSLRLKILEVAVGDNSFLGRWFRLFGIRLRKLSLPTEFNGLEVVRGS